MFVGNKKLMVSETTRIKKEIKSILRENHGILFSSRVFDDYVFLYTIRVLPKGTTLSDGTKAIKQDIKPFLAFLSGIREARSPRNRIKYKRR